MSRIFVTGMSGTGKSSVLAELARRGYRVVDTDDPGWREYRKHAEPVDEAIMEGLNTTILKECVIPLPSLPDQERIAALLHDADSVRRKRRYQLELSEHLFASLLHKAFAEPLPEALTG